MTTYSTDLIQYVFNQSQLGFDTIDTTALNVLIQDYLETPDNGYMLETVEEWNDDTTSYVTYVTDSTSPTITVLEWKELYLEQTLNQSYLQNGQISIRDSNSPNYPLINFKDKLFDFDTTTSIDYSILADATADVFIEYELPTARKVDGMYIQHGIDGIDSTTGESTLICFIGFSNDGSTWTYIADDSGDSAIYTNKQDAIDNAFDLTVDGVDIEPQAVSDVMFTDTSIEAKYWRIYFVDGDYTAAVSHLRFEQIREHGEAVVSKTLPLIKTTGVYSAGITNVVSDVSGAAWFSTLEFEYTLYGHKRVTITTTARVNSDSTCEFRIRIKNEDAAWVERDIVEVDNQFASLTDSVILINPSDDLATVWTVLVDIQDKSPVAGAASIDLKLSSNSNFRSTS